MRAYMLLRVCSARLSIGAILVGSVGVDCVSIGLLTVLAGRHSLIYPVQPTRLLKVTNLPCGRKSLDGCKAEEMW